MKIIANSIRAGNVLEYKGRLWVVSKTPSWAMPGKGGAFVQVEMKDVKTGNKLNERFRSSEEVEKVRLDQKDYQFLYMNDEMMTFMNCENYEQIEIDKAMLGERAAFLQETMVVQIESYEDSPLNIMLPDTIIATISEADPVVKGQTVTSSYKPALLENGVKVMVPPFVESGTKIVVKTEDASYVERAKE